MIDMTSGMVVIKIDHEKLLEDQVKYGMREAIQDVSDRVSLNDLSQFALTALEAGADRTEGQNRASIIEEMKSKSPVSDRLLDSDIVKLADVAITAYSSLRPISGYDQLADVVGHLASEFGEDQVQRVFNMFAPSQGQRFEVVRPLETCHESSGWHLVAGRVPVGKYEVISRIRPDVSSHWLQITPLGVENPPCMQFCLGYAMGSPTMVDWRGVKRID